MKKKIKNKSNAKTLSSTSLRHGLFRRPHYDMVSFVDLTIKWPLRSLKVILKKKRGFYDYRSDDYVSIVQWKDNKVVYIASNFVNITSIKVVKRYSQRERKEINCPQPFWFYQYNLGMGDVDLLDRFINQHRPIIHGKKWYWPLF